MSRFVSRTAGKARYAILMWLLGVPLPIILLIWMVKGCV